MISRIDARGLLLVSTILTGGAVCAGGCGKGTAQTSAPSIDDGVCGDLFDAMLAQYGKCAVLPALAPSLGGGGGGGGPLLDASQRAVFVDYYCHVLASAQGTGDLAGELGACTTALQGATSCAAFADPACTLRGTLPAGAACGSSAQCQSAACTVSNSAPPDPNSEMQCGTCAPVLAAGDVCAGPGVTGVCDTGLSCGAALVTEDTGVEVACGPYVKQGDSCANSCSPQPCVPPGCAPGLTCDAQAQTCQPVPPPIAEGQPCSMMGCAPGLMCGEPADAASPADVCVKAPVAGQGQHCVVGATPINCDTGLECQSGSCQPFPTVGSPCSPHSGQCYPSPLLCTGGTCQQPDLSSCK